MNSQSFADLSGRQAVVTGASSGIGRAIALEFARAGADVLLHCNQSVNAATQVVEEIRQMGQQAELLVQDFAEPDFWTGFVDRCFSGQPEVGIWVNNAGVDLLTGSGAKWGYDKKLQSLLDIDVQSTVMLSRLVGQRFVDGEGGVILNIGWDQSDRGMEGESGELFATAKNAIMGFTRSLAVSLAPSVRVNCIAPGWIRTAWGDQASGAWQQRVMRETPLKRWGTPEDIARMARFLVSDEANYITGQVFNVNGGAVR